VDFRRFLAFVVLPLALLVAGACTLDNTPPQTAAGGLGATLPPEIEKQVGPAYQSPDLQAMVNRVGQKLVSRSGLNGNYRFFILDEPVANAHAIGPNYVFVTRGLLAVIDDEAELAAAFGHELGHVTLHHAAERERERKVVMDAAIKAAVASGSITVGRSVAREGMIELRRYSRDQELEADRAGVGYLVRAGYRGSAMASLIEKLRRQSKLEDDILGPAFDPEDQASALSTHPAPDERLAALQSVDDARAPGESDRSQYLSLVDGMSVDDAPEEGFVRGPAFLHPVLRIAFQAPADFVLFNDHDGVLGIGRDRSLMYFSCTDEHIAGHLDDWMRNQLKPTPADIQLTEIGGVEAAIGAKPRGSDSGLAQVRYVVLRNGPGICYFSLLSEGADRDQRINALVVSARSFHFLSDAQAAALRPYRLRVIARDGAPAASLARRLPYTDHRLERLLVLNGVDTAAEFAKRAEVKIVEP
jgi:predicted Zn-dependent protease